MDNHMTWVHDQRIENMIKEMKTNHMTGYHVKNTTELFNILNTLIKDGDSVSVGGSMTLFETGTIDYLRNRTLNFWDRYEENLTPDDITELYFKTFGADVFVTSSNAITETGGLYNVDGRGNRVAAMIYGPKKVVVIVGSNKIVKDLDGAIERNRRISAPANAKRLNRKTPCAELGYCTSCKSEDKICHAYTYITSQMIKDRIHVIIIDEAYGY